MAIILPDVGAAKILAAYFNNSWPASKDLTLKLFSNDRTPADTDTAASYTIPSGGGYSNIALSSGSWVLSTVGGIVQAAYPQQVWTFTTNLNGYAFVYGWIIVDADNTLIYADRLVNRFQPLSPGDTITIIPTIQLSKGLPT